MKTIDFNCDLGEGLENDERIMPLISSCNISCGFHAGGPSIIRRTVELAIKNKVKVGAHPSYDDKKNFGRISIEISFSDLFDLVLYQVAALKSITESFGERLSHVKLHGALYNDSAKDLKKAEVCFSAVKKIDSTICIYGQPASSHKIAAEKLSLKFMNEAFADRLYDDEGFLVSRKIEGSVIVNTKEVADQVLGIAKNSSITTIGDKKVKIQADTICFHGDHPNALENIEMSKSLLKSHSITVS